MKHRKMLLVAAMMSIVMTMPAFAGWQKVANGFAYYDENGNVQKGGVTPDGYLVDGNGIWTKRTIDIMGVTVSVPDQFYQYQNTESFLTELSSINEKLQKDFPNKRSFHVYNRSVHYYSLDDNKNETEIMTFSLQSDGYELDLKTRVGSRNGTSNSILNYDYAVLQFFIAKISHGPELLTDAIVENWQGTNSYGLTLFQTLNVGDAKVKVTAESGKGIYTIRSCR